MHRHASPRCLRAALVATVCLALAACAVTPSESTRTAAGGAYPPTATVEILDAPPSRAYQEIGALDAPGEPGALRAQVLAQLTEKARALGADAVIVRDVSYRAPVTQRLNPTTGFYESVGGQMVPAFKGTAIKYR